MFSDCRYKPTYPAKGVCAVIAAEAPGDFLLHLSHSYIALREIIIERYRQIINKSQRFVCVFVQSIQEISGRRLLQTATLSRFAHFLADRVCPVATCDKFRISVSIISKCCRSKRTMLGSVGALNRKFHSAQETDHSACPALFQFLFYKDKLTEMMCIAETVAAFEVKIGCPSVMNRPTCISCNHAAIFHSLGASAGMAEIVCVSVGAAHMLPPPFASYIHAGFIHMHDRRSADCGFDRCFGLLKECMRLHDNTVQRSFTHVHIKNVAHRFDKTILRHHLKTRKVYCDRPDAIAILHRSCNIFRELRSMLLSTSASSHLRLVFGNFQTNRRQIENLPSRVAKEFPRIQGPSAAALSMQFMNAHIVRILNPMQRMAVMSRLAAVWLAGFLPQVLRLSMHIARRRLTAVVAVFGNLSLQPSDFLVCFTKLCFKSSDLVFKRIKSRNQHFNERYNGIFTLPVNSSNLIAGHRNGHDCKLQSRPGLALVLYVNIRYLRPPTLQPVVG